MHDAQDDERWQSNGAKRSGPWELWAIYKFREKERTWLVHRYATEAMARQAGDMLLRKHPTFYVGDEVRVR